LSPTVSRSSNNKTISKLEFALACPQSMQLFIYFFQIVLDLRNIAFFGGARKSKIYLEENLL